MESGDVIVYGVAHKHEYIARPRAKTGDLVFCGWRSMQRRRAKQ